MSFFKKVILYMIIPAILPVIITTHLYFLAFEPEFKKTIINSINMISKSLGDELSNSLIESVMNTEQLSENPILLSNDRSKEESEEELKKTVNYHKIFKDISVINKMGNIHASVNYSFRGELNETKWFQDALKGKIVVSDVHALLYPYEIVVSIFSPIIKADKTIDEIIVSQLDMEQIWDLVDLKNQRMNGDFWVINDKGIVIASPIREMIMEKFPNENIYNMSKENNNWEQQIQVIGSNYDFFITPIKIIKQFSPNWNVVYVEESKTVFSTLNKFRIILIFRGLISIFLIIFLSLLFSKKLSKRISLLRDATLQLGKGNYSMELIDKGKDEVSDLFKSFSKTQLKLEASDNLLKSSNERFELAVKGANDAIWDWDMVNDNIYFSSKWFEMIGLKDKKHYFTVDDWLNIIHIEDRERFEKNLNLLFFDKLVHFEEEYRIVRSDNSIKWIMTRGIAIYDKDNNLLRMAGSHADITNRKDMEQKVSFYAYYDSLTELPNRAMFMDRLNQALNRAMRNKDYSFCLFFLDFDGFKHVNDTYGHNVGDLLLIEISKRLKLCVRPFDIVARLGGDEFVILLDGVDDHQLIVSILDRVLETSREEFKLKNHSILTSASIGVVKEIDGRSKPEELIQKADIAMYHSKMNGKDRYTFFVDKLQHKENNRWSLENELHKALGTDALEIYYQPIYASNMNEIFSFEALLRWNHPNKGMIPPDEFISSAEETGFISEITKWLIEQVCLKARDWNQKQEDKTILISFNVTAKDFLIPQGLDHLIENILYKSQCEANWIGLEITEKTMIKDLGTVLEQINKIKAMGIIIELDDFGTGYSSLSYLNKFDIDYIKIDKMFISSMIKNPMNLKIVKTIINLAHDLDLLVIAEGVETEAELIKLKELDCEFFQGYYFSKPLKAKDALKRLIEEKQV